MTRPGNFETQPATVDAIAFARANERLRQETETFEERKRQSRLWFQLRMGVGISSIVALGVIIAVSTYVIVSNDKFTPGVYLTAMVALLADVLGIITLVWKVILAPESTATLQPVTGDAFPATE